MTRRRARPFRDIDIRVNHCETWQFKRALAVLGHCSARAFVNKVFAQKAGAKRKLTGDALIVAFLLTPMLSMDMHLVMVTATIRGWSPSQRRAVGLDKGVDVTYKMVCDGFAKLCRVCDRVDDDDAADEVADYGVASLAQAFLNASLSIYPPTGAVALDSTDLETWARIRYSKVLVDEDPDTPPQDRQDHPADATRQQRRSVKRAHHRPLAPREPPDYRRRYTVDPDARAAHRSAGATETSIYVGYEAHVVTDVPAKPGTGPVPHVARSMHLVCAGYHRGVAGLIAVLFAGDLPRPHEVICDRAYNWTRAVLFSLPLLRCGYTPIVDLHSRQYGVHPGPIEGTLWIDGTLYTECLPQRLRHIPRLTRDMDEGDKIRAQQERALRAPYEFVPLGAKRRDGTQRFRGPAVWPARIRSPLSPRSMRLGYEHPTVQCDRRRPDDPCACCKTVTLSNEDQPQIRMPFPHGSRQWFASYYRRVGIESAFGGLKSNVLHLRRGYFRIFGLTAHRLLLGFTLAAMNVVTLRYWHLERDLPDPWGQVLGEPDPPPAASRRRSSRRGASHRARADGNGL